MWPILLNELSQRTSFANAIRATAALGGVMLFASNCVMRTQLRQKSASHNKPNFRVIFRDYAYLICIVSYVRIYWSYIDILMQFIELSPSILDSSSRVYICFIAAVVVS